VKQITLIRHAKVDIDNSKKINSLLLQQWIKEYDFAPIETRSLPPQETIYLAKNADIVLVSSLRRSLDSAKVLGVDVTEQNGIFNEAAIPEVKFPLLKLKPKTWLVILRILLLFGLGKKDTSLKASTLRAKEASQKLISLSTTHDHIALVGHGGMNWLISKELKKEGWKPEGKESHENWSATILTM